jgi:hypothetical protein
MRRGREQACFAVASFFGFPAPSIKLLVLPCNLRFAPTQLAIDFFELNILLVQQSALLVQGIDRERPSMEQASHEQQGYRRQFAIDEEAFA